MAEQNWNYGFGGDETVFSRYLRCYESQRPLEDINGNSSSRRVGIMCVKYILRYYITAPSKFP